MEGYTPVGKEQLSKAPNVRTKTEQMAELAKQKRQRKEEEERKQLQKIDDSIDHEKVFIVMRVDHIIKNMDKMFTCISLPWLIKLVRIKYHHDYKRIVCERVTKLIKEQYQPLGYKITNVSMRYESCNGRRKIKPEWYTVKISIPSRSCIII